MTGVFGITWWNVLGVLTGIVIVGYAWLLLSTLEEIRDILKRQRR